MQVWDLDYLSSSDDEDDDDDDEDQDEDSDDAEIVNKRKVNKPRIADVVDRLIEQDKELTKRDLDCRVRKHKMRHQVKSRILTLNETPEDMEKFKEWWNPHMESVYFAMHCRHKTSYRKGDQLFNSYGTRNNRHLITNYGFCLRHNRYNSLGFKVFVNVKDEASQTQQHVKILKLKKGRVSEPLL